MSKLKLTEQQILMLQKLEETSPKKKVLKIDEAQAIRIFKDVTLINESTIEKKAINLSEFAQELIVFIKDIISNPNELKFSPYWGQLNISKGQLFRLLKNEGLLEDMVSDGVNSYGSKKSGFRRGIKTIFKEIKNKRGKLTEIGYSGGGYPPGAEDDPRAPYNEPMYNDDEDEDDFEGPRQPMKSILNLVYYSKELDDLVLFHHQDKMYLFMSGNMDGELLDPYQDFQKGSPEKDAIMNYLNDNISEDDLNSGQSDFYAINGNKDSGVVKLVTPEVKEELINFSRKYVGENPELENLLNQLPESTGAASSGSFVGGASFGKTIQKDTGISPEQAMGSLNETDIDSSYTHFGVSKETGKIVNGWDYEGLDKEDVAYYSKIDFKDDFPDKNPRDFKVSTKGYLEKKGIDPYNPENWEAYNAPLQEMDSATAGGDSGTFAFDAPAGDGSAFWTAGNKQNKGMPMVRREGVNEGDDDRYEYHRFLELYKRSIPKSSERKKIIRLLYKAAGKLGITLDLTEAYKKVLKITESQFNLIKLSETKNSTSTAYPNGEMVDFDDCTKLNNNKVAQNGGCSQGAIDNVVKLKKTKDSVVS